MYFQLTWIDLQLYWYETIWTEYCHLVEWKNACGIIKKAIIVKSVLEHLLPAQKSQKWRSYHDITRFLQYNILPFGLPTAPYVFTNLLKSLLTFWQSHNTCPLSGRWSWYSWRQDDTTSSSASCPKRLTESWFPPALELNSIIHLRYEKFIVLLLLLGAGGKKI